MAVHDLTAARQVGLIDALTRANLPTFTDQGSQGAGDTIRTSGMGDTICTSFKRHRHRPILPCGQRSVDRAHAHIRSIDEHAVTPLRAGKCRSGSVVASGALPRSSEPSSFYRRPKPITTRDEETSAFQGRSPSANYPKSLA